MLSPVCNDYSRDYCLSSCMQVARGRSPMRSTTPLGRSASRSLSRLRSRSPSPRRSARGSRTYRVYGVSSTMIVLVVYFAKRLIAWFLLYWQLFSFVIAGAASPSRLGTYWCRWAEGQLGQFGRIAGNIWLSDFLCAVVVSLGYLQIRAIVSLLLAYLIYVWNTF